MAFNWAYKTRDVMFVLKEWLDTEKIFAYDKFKDYYTKDDIDMIIDPVYKICRDMIAPSNDDGEKEPARYENGKVYVPESFAKNFKYIQENGYGTANIDENAEGTIPYVVYAALQEMIASANPTWAAYLALTTGAAGLIQAFGDEKLKEMFLPKMFSGEWAGTMCLTEPTAGSDVGDILSKAYPTEHPRIFKIKGSKIFITGGEHNMTENIVHLFLARVEGALPGTKGISLFVVPKYWVNEDGTLEDNDVQCVGIEHKMGQHGSSTAALSFGENGNCRGWLLGANPLENEGRGEGMAQMFKMMNEERLGTGHAALAVAANAYFNAAEYAKERIQGRPLTNPKGDRVRIIEHEDVRRMLLYAKAHTEAIRAMIFKAFYYVDMKEHDPDPAVREKAADMVAILTPLVKAHASDEAWPIIAECIQTYGGYGYCEEYPVAQAARDVKIYSIWEGTNYIQSMDLIGRKWTMKKGQPFASFIQEIRDFVEANKNTPGFEKEFANLEKALNAYGEIQMAVGQAFANKQFGLVPTFARRILTATSYLYCGMLILSQALLADAKMKELGSDHYDYSFYAGKVTAARYYLMNTVPYVWSLAEIMKSGDTSVIDAPVEIFEY
ncbi:acyl-CoA dehydrogenase [Thermosyntropha sp.]|uniref:acyl-CoA dehydrogenase n=1 Tax=Thermosyntropha sp. TaxID=2740820 RepID=UPI0025D84333|nr:acyl-CoA dehydrogenase [Thermosyntropha sp.]MBO8158719.1 acyl-CoA dehydrogenase [Thermosyntropha sp.]